jgi:4'-phosphopantetheinyl transferase
MLKSKKLAMSALVIDWPGPPRDWTLAEHEIHVWASSLAADKIQLAAYEQTLSSDESERAARYRFDQHRNRFITGRGWLRSVLSHYLDQEVGEIRFEYNANGKPAMRAREPALRFNLAHCDDLAVLAVTRAAEVGVDVERLRPLKDADDIADRFFSRTESEGLKALTATQKPAGFFNLWTRKEAWLKATGEGLSDSLNQVEVSFLPEERARLVRLFGKTDEIHNWTLGEFVPAAGFVGAIAAHAPNLEITYWRWSEPG